MKQCDCVTACMLTSAERYHGRIRCRYRHGAVQPPVGVSRQEWERIRADRRAPESRAKEIPDE